MRFISVLLLSLFLFPAALSQTKLLLERKAELALGDQKQHVLTHKFVGSENRLLLIGQKTVRVVDVAAGKLVASRPIDVPDFTEDKPRLVSPDGRRMIIFGNYDRRRKKEKLYPPSVWDLQTGKQIAVLNKATKPVRHAFWSKNGKTLVTSSDKY